MTSSCLLPTLSDHNKRMVQVSQDYLVETYGWNSSYSDNTKLIPYGANWTALRSLQKIGDGLYQKCPTVRSAIEKFVSYVVGAGHTYDVSKRPVPSSRTGVRVSDRLLKEIDWIIQCTQQSCYPGGWAQMQAESICRKLRHGEFFRRKFSGADGLKVRFIEPFQIRQPPDSNEPGVLGVIYGERDFSQPVGYWVLRDPTKAGDRDFYDVATSLEVQHSKYGVDANDTRGVTPFWIVICHSERIKQIDLAMVELAMTQSSYAVIRQYENFITADEIRKIAGGFKEASQTDEGERVFGKEVEARGFKFEFPSMGIDPKNFIEIINEEKRSIAGVLDMPEFILLAGDSGGSRANGIAKEGPFARRIVREQVQLGYHDVDLLWSAVADEKGWDEERLSLYRKAIKIEPDFPIPHTRDILKDTQAVKLQVEMGAESKRGAAEKLGNDYDNVKQERAKEPDEQPAVKPAANPAQAVVDAGDRKPSGRNPKPARP